MGSVIKEMYNLNSAEIKSIIKDHVTSIKEKELYNKDLDFDLFEKVLGYVYRYHKTYINQICSIESILLRYGNPYGVLFNEFNWNPSISVLGILRLNQSIKQEYKNILYFYKTIQNVNEY